MYFAWDRADGREAAIFKEGNSATRGHPNPILKVLIEGLDRIIGQSACGLAINSNAAIIPPVQALSSAEPDAAIPGRENGFNRGIRQTLLDRNRGDCEVAKAV